MALLVLDVPAQGGALTVPEVDLIAVLGSRLFQKLDAPLKLLSVGLSKAHGLLQLGDAL